jgi:hypothetical protein
MTPHLLSEVPGRLEPEDGLRLSTALEQTLASRGEEGRHVSGLERRPSAYRSSCALDDIDVWFDDGSTLALMAKAVDWRAMCPEAQRARPRQLWDEARERAVYESILPASGVTSARYFGSYVGQSGVRYLLLERIAGSPLWQYGDFRAWREAARWLARMRVRVGPEILAASGAAAHLLRYTRPFYDSWMRRACAFHASSTRAMHALSDSYRKVVDWLLCESASFLHGDFYSSNVVIEHAAGRPYTVRPVDWEMAAVGPPSIDLACLLAGNWTDDERAAAADAYYSELAALGHPVPDRERYRRTLDYCLIHLSVRNLGWSGDWSPPSDRVHDWLGEAFRLCEKWQL